MLRSLVWKEWREQRPIVLSGILVAIVLPVLILAATVLASTSDRVVASAQIVPLFYVAVLWPLFAVAAGATTITSDNSPAQLGFLLSRPAPRWLIWATKIGTGLAGFALLIAVSELLVRGLGAATGAPAMSTLAPIPDFVSGPGVRVLLPALVLGFNLVCFASATFFASAMRRPLIVALLAGIVAVVHWVSTTAVWWLIDYMPGGDLVFAAFALLGALALFAGCGLAASLTVFVRGELLHGSRARSIAFGGAVVATAISFAFVGTTALYAARGPGSDAVFSEIAVAANGQTLAVTAGRPGAGASRRIWIMDLDTGARLATTRRLAHQPGLSPDGEWLAYTSVRGLFGLRSDRAQLRIMRTDGTEDRVLASGLPFDGNGPPAFSPDGRRVLISTGAGLYIADRAGGSPRIAALRRPGMPSCELAAWDKGSDQPLLLCGTRSAAEVRWIDPDNGETVRRFELPAGQRWSMPRTAATLPSGNHLALWLREPEAGDYGRHPWALDLRRQVLAPVHTDADSLASAFASDGSRLVYAVPADREPGAAAAMVEIRVQESAGGESRLLGKVTGGRVSLRFAPGDQWIVVSGAMDADNLDARASSEVFAVDGSARRQRLGSSMKWLHLEFLSRWAGGGGERLVELGRRIGDGRGSTAWFHDIRVHDLRTGQAALLTGY